MHASPGSAALSGTATSPEDDDVRLAVRGLSKTFGRNRALRDVTLDVVPGEVHGLIGQNGCGKSTLAKILTGFHAPDPGGVVRVDGVPVRLPVRPLEARSRGVTVVHQNLGLVDEHTALENLRVGRVRPGRLSRRIRWQAEREAVLPILERLGRQVPLDVPVGRLSEEDRATVAIARAVQDVEDGGGLVVFDESTRSLSRPTMEHFYELVDEIVATGTSVLLISHGLEEVLQVADRVTVLRDGVVVASGVGTAGMSETALAGLVLGRDVGAAARPVSERATAPRVTVSGLTGAFVRDVDLAIADGEVLGVTGLPDGGYGEIPYLVSGARTASSGRLTWHLADGGTGGTDVEVDLASLDVRDAVAQGIVLVPEGREHAGLAMTMSVCDNIALPQVGAGRARGLPIDPGLAKDTVATWLGELDVRPRAPHLPVSKLSGGNQQKVLLAKWLATRPRLLVLHEPTQAVDVGARRAIIAAVRAAAAQGCAVLVAGADENELCLLCDRVLVVRDGRIADELAGGFTPDDIVHRTFASTRRRELRPSRAGRP